ncbi:MAG: hypothetical protein OC190_11030 [Novosphingobium aromaticivorans]|nr:hypothetical protein [Novosphingobium aromaticivorans]
MMKMGHRWLVAGALALLAGCHGQESPADKAGAKAAGGEVLPGSVSDAMIDLDGATGTPPLQPPPPVKMDRVKAEASAPAEAPPVQDQADSPAQDRAGN